MGKTNFFDLEKGGGHGALSGNCQKSENLWQTRLVLVSNTLVLDRNYVTKT